MPCQARIQRSRCIAKCVPVLDNALKDVLGTSVHGDYLSMYYHSESLSGSDVLELLPELVLVRCLVVALKV